MRNTEFEYISKFVLRYGIGFWVTQSEAKRIKPHRLIEFTALVAQHARLLSIFEMNMQGS